MIGHILDEGKGVGGIIEAGLGQPSRIPHGTCLDLHVTIVVRVEVGFHSDDLPLGEDGLGDPGHGLPHRIQIVIVIVVGALAADACIRVEAVVAVLPRSDSGRLALDAIFVGDPVTAVHGEGGRREREYHIIRFGATGKEFQKRKRRERRPSMCGWLGGWIALQIDLPRLLPSGGGHVSVAIDDGGADEGQEQDGEGAHLAHHSCVIFLSIICWENFF